MKTTLAALALLTATTLFAAEPYVPQPQSFPDDFTPAACAPKNSCESFSQDEIGANAFRYLGLELNERWIASHYDEIMQLFAPICRKHATCVGTLNNPVMFCTDLAAPMFYASCATKYTDPHDLESCRQFAQIYSLGVDQYSRKPGKEAQECAAKEPPVTHAKPPKIWMYPESINYGYTGNVVFYSLDPDTNVPVMSHITFQGQKLYAPSNPTGETATYYTFKLPFKYVRERNSVGHEDVLPPMVTFKTEGYPDVQFRLPTPTPNATAELQPRLDKLKAGVDNQVFVKTVDTLSGKPAEMQVMMGDGSVGDTNTPITIRWEKGTKRPDLWVRSPFDRYGDIVLAPAEQ